MEEVPASEAYEHSEMLMYAATVLSEGGKPEAALAYLDKRRVGGVGLGGLCLGALDRSPGQY